MKTIISRYDGANESDPSWVKEIRSIEDSEVVDSGWEVIELHEAKRLRRNQKVFLDSWLESLNTEIVLHDEGTYKDYKQARIGLKTLIQAKGGFTALTSVEKTKATEWFLCTPEEMMNHFIGNLGMTSEQAFKQKLNNAGVFAHKSFVSRNHRFNAIVIFVRNAVDRVDLDNIFSDVTLTKDNADKEIKMKENYLEIGREGTMKVNYEGEQDKIGLFDYILGTQSCTDLGLPTLASRITTPLYGFTVQNIIDKCMDILDNGNY